MAKTKEKEYTYVDLEDKNINRVCEILKQFEMAIRSSYPLPTEWLLDSLEAGVPLDHEGYRKV